VRLFIAAYFIDTGLLLLAAPWTIWWRQNFFAEVLPWLDALMRTRTCHVWVMATGFVTAAAGVIEVYELVTARAPDDGATDASPLI
jgi:hypothetical protein